MTRGVRQRFGKKAPQALVALIVVTVGVSLASAEQADIGVFNGTVVDGLGGVLPGVTVTARDSSSGLTRSAVTGPGGDYTMRLPTGSYDVEASLLGFAAASAAVTIGASPTERDFTLEIAPLAETVTVTRTDQTLSAIPNAVVVVQADRIDFAQRKSSLDEALRGIPGVLVQNRRNYGLSGGIGLSIRAPQPRFGLRGLALIQDGIPITTADGTTEPGNIDLGSAGQIEVVRGPSSVLYGNSAGGVINVFTGIDESRRLTVRPDIQFGSNGYQRQQIRLDGHNNSGTEFMGSFSHFQTDGWREQSAAKINQGNLLVRQALSANTDLSGIFNYYDSPFAESPSFLNFDDAMNNPRSARGISIRQNWGEAASQGQGGVTLEHRFARSQAIRVTGWAVTRDLFASGPGQVINLGRKGGGFRSQYVGSAGAIEWIAGVDVSSQNDSRIEYARPSFGSPLPADEVVKNGDINIDQGEDVLSVGPFAQVSVRPHDRVTITGGVRYDYYKFEAKDRKLDDGDQTGDRTMNQASPMVGLTFAATPTLNLYTNFATAYETPTTVELSNTPTGEGGFNQLLDPERLRSFEVGFRGLLQPARLQYDIAVYNSRLLDAFVPFQRPDEQVFILNAGESSRNGVELALNWRPVTQLATRFAYTYQDFIFQDFVLDGDDFNGNVEPGTVPNRVFFGIDHAAPFGLRSSFNVRWVDEIFVNNANDEANWAYTVVDLRFGWEQMWGDVGVRPFLGIDNLFNERYNSSIISNGFGRRYYESSPDREFYGGITFDFGVR